MTAERWKQIEVVFEAAIELAGGAREAYLQKACQGDAGLLTEVRALLASDQEANGFVERQVEDGIITLDMDESAPIVMRAGPYLLTRELGRGGMGTVYLGERADGQYEGEVAVKLVRRGMDTEFFLARFRRERQALARLRHPNIARLLDSGSTEDGSPYLVMELVDGKPINAYCREHKLDIQSTLRLFVQVCRAVSHAHHHFVVHRDLKPGNILVDVSGAPRLLDFGICKLLIAGAPENRDAPETTRLMTPDYASPEQVRGDPITVSSDIYSLGAVLYELLTGKRPHGIEKYTPQEVAIAVCDRDVTRPSEAAIHADRGRDLAGDLDTILLKAMQKDPTRRYESVEQFAEDLRRVLDHEPVLARPDTALYRVRKFAQRHTVGTAAAILAAVTLTGAAAAYAHQASVARRESAEARKMANALMFEIHDKIRDLPGALPARESIVRMGLNYLDRLSAENSSDESLRLDLASGYLRIGRVQGAVLDSNKGDTEGALTSYRRGLKALEPLGSAREAGLLRVDLHRSMSQVLNTRSTAEALRNIEEAIGIAEELHRKHPNDDEVSRRLAGLYQSAALSLRMGEQRPRALELSTKSRDLFRQLLARHPEDSELHSELAGVMSNAGVIQGGLGQLSEARASLETAIAEWEKLAAKEPSNNGIQRFRMLAYSHLGDLLGNPNYTNLGDTAGAIGAYRSMIAVAEVRYRANPGDQGATIDYGMALARTAAIPAGSTDDRLELYRKSASLLHEALERDPANTTVAMNLASHKDEAGDLLVAAGRLPEARVSFRQGLDLLRGQKARSSPPAIRVALSIARKLGEDAAKRGNRAEALSMAALSLEAVEKVADKDPMPAHVNQARAFASAASIHLALGSEDEARRWFERSMELYRNLQGRPGFTSAHRKQMQGVEASLAKLTKEEARR